MAQRHMDRLTSFDTSFLANEKESAHMAIGAIFICAGPTPSYEDFLTHVRSRLHLLPRFRQRVVFPPAQLGRPFWVDDPDFDIANHVRHEALPAPGTEEQFRELIGKSLSPPLDRSRPLWELWLVEGLEGDRFGVIYKTHHALADGISAVDAGALLFDIKPVHEPVREEAPWTPKTPPSRPRLLWHAVLGIGVTARRLLRWLGRTARRPRRSLRRALDSIAGVWEVGTAFLKPAPQVPVNVKIGPDRAFCWTRCRLADFKRIKNALGGTVNDVALAVTAGALRRWLHDQGVSTDGLRMQALVPVSIRAENEHGELGNKLTAMRGPLPVYCEDPVERLRIVTEAMGKLKSSKQPFGAEAIWALNDWFRDFAPPFLLGITARINFSTRLFNLLVTNFPGPQIPFYVLGGELLDVIPIGFLARNHGLAVAIISYNGGINFGFLSDRAAIPGTEELSRYLADSVEELKAAAGVAEAAGESSAAVAKLAG